MQSEEIRKRFLKFFEKRGHSIIPSASLVPENDPSVLFTTAGMHPLVPYLLGETHPLGKRLVNIQKCVRTSDIDEVGDNTHDTFFEMMGNWSLGDPDARDGVGAGYFKKEAIEWSYELLTSKDEGFGLDPERLFITCFEGDENAPKDDESAEIWRDIFEREGIKGERIYFMPAKNNWWSAGDNGPCGPDTEMFYDTTGLLTAGMNKDEYIRADREERVVEIWNDVFMEYLKEGGKVVGKLKQKNVDTGAGLERVAMALQGKDNIYDTDLFNEVMSKINDFTAIDNVRAKRIVADHIRTAVFMIADGVIPTNTDRGYILRRLLRRAIRFSDVLQTGTGFLTELIDSIIEKYGNTYSNLLDKRALIGDEIIKEEERFRKNLSIGIKEFSRFPTGTISGANASMLFTTYGFPFEMTRELAIERGDSIDEEGFKGEMKKHQDISRRGAEKKFKGGLADTSVKSVKYHTATHLLHKALKEVLGGHVFQKGSNITPERLRFDFSFERKMTDEEKKKTEDLVNQKIKEALPVSYEDIPLEEAQKKGAIGLFEEKYGDRVRVYKIGGFSLEFCGGPHVKNTGELGNFKIIKEEAVGGGIRRIKAVFV